MIPRLAIITQNTLEATGLKSILDDIIPGADVTVFNSLEQFQDEHAITPFVHFFVSPEVLILDAVVPSAVGVCADPRGIPGISEVYAAPELLVHGAALGVVDGRVTYGLRVLVVVNWGQTVVAGTAACEEEYGG